MSPGYDKDQTHLEALMKMVRVKHVQATSAEILYTTMSVRLCVCNCVVLFVCLSVCFVLGVCLFVYLFITGVSMIVHRCLFVIVLLCVHLYFMRVCLFVCLFVVGICQCMFWCV